jgi:hypothetical protein
MKVQWKTLGQVYYIYKNLFSKNSEQISFESKTKYIFVYQLINSWLGNLCNKILDEIYV